MSGKVLKTRCHGDPTRARIQNAAMKLFAKNGFAGTTISQIAKKAKVNHSLIFHHFENKAMLWKTVKQNILDRLNESMEHDLFDTQHGLKAFLTTLVTVRIQFHFQNKDIDRMLNWQRLESNQEILMGGTKYKLGQLTEAVKQLQEQGEIRRDLDTEMVRTFIASASRLSYFEKMNFLTKDKEQAKEEYIKMVIDCLIRALQPQG